jgi:hypothetical protein
VFKKEIFEVDWYYEVLIKVELKGLNNINKKLELENNKRRIKNLGIGNYNNS